MSSRGDESDARDGNGSSTLHRFPELLSEVNLRRIGASVQFSTKVKGHERLTWYPGLMVIFCPTSFPPLETSMRLTPLLIASWRSTSLCSIPHEIHSPFASFSPLTCQSVAEIRRKRGLCAGHLEREISMISTASRSRFSLRSRTLVRDSGRRGDARTEILRRRQFGGWRGERGSCGSGGQSVSAILG